MTDRAFSPRRFLAEAQRSAVILAGPRRSEGRSIEPLHTGVPIAVQTDKALYAWLALVDVLRVGRAREREFAEAELQRRIADVRS